MRRSCCHLLFALLFGLVLLGCEPPTQTGSSPAGPPLPPPPPGSEPPGPTDPAANTSPAPTEGPTEAPPPPETKFGAFAGGIDDLAARPAAPSAPTSGAATENPETERVKAEKGVGIKGRSLDQYEGVIVTPAKQYFNIRERVVFEIQIPHTLNLYKASEGKGPASHDEFMEKIVKANQIKLPQLPPYAKYVYDVEQEQLMVERPKQQ